MRFAPLAFLLSLPVFGCGGSSSETPPPLQPDPTSARYTGPRMPNAEDDAAPAAAREPDEDDQLQQPRRAAPTTWGSGKPAPVTPETPKMTSPTALPAGSSPAPAPLSPTPGASSAPPAN